MNTGPGPRRCTDCRREVPSGATRCEPCRWMQAIHQERHRELVAQFEAGSQRDVPGTIPVLRVEIERSPEAEAPDQRRRRLSGDNGPGIRRPGGRLVRQEDRQTKPLTACGPFSEGRGALNSALNVLPERGLSAKQRLQKFVVRLLTGRAREW